MLMDQTKQPHNIRFLFVGLTSGVLPQAAVLVSAKKTKKGRTLVEKMKALYETLRDYKDPKGRQLSLIFLRLPNIKEFPGTFFS